MSKYEKLEPVFAELDSGDEHIHPMFNNDSFSEYEPPRKKAPVLVIGSLLILAFLGGGLVFAYKQGVREGNRSAPPVITADKTPVKITPEKRGGINIPNQDKRVYDRLDKNTVKVTERLMPAPEEVMDLPKEPQTPAPAQKGGSGVDMANPDVPYAPEMPDSPETPPVASGLIRNKIVELVPPVQNPPRSTTLLPSREVDILTITPDGVFKTPPPAAIPAENPVEIAKISPPPAIAAPPVTIGKIPELEDGKTLTERLIEAEKDLTKPVKKPVAEKTVKNESRLSPAPAPEVIAKDTGASIRVAGLPPVSKPKPLRPAPRAKPRPAALAAPEKLVPIAKPAFTKPKPVVKKPVVKDARVNSGSYVVQIASHRKQVDALAEFAGLQRRHPKLVGNYKPSIQRANLGDRGIYYRLRIGSMPSRADAAQFCEQFKALGGNGCLIRRK